MRRNLVLCRICSRNLCRNERDCRGRKSRKGEGGSKGKSTLNKHAGKHGYASPKEYLKDARNFLEKKPTSTIQSFVSNEGTYFRYDTTTNEFGIINKYGGISTYFKPENGMVYWLEQIEKYAPK